jgi:hypothetical protein
MPVIARDSVASDHLVYAWPFPIGPEEYEVVCAEDEQVVMCPSWVVGGLFHVGRHRWRSPDPRFPVSAYFVLTAPVEVSFDMATTFQIPSTGQSVRVRANGSLQVRCSDPSLLIAQFVGLPFDAVNEGILRSVSRSVERMLARLLTRRVVMGGTPAVVTDPVVLPNIIEELVAYNPAAGAVFGVELMRMGHLAIAADDGTRPLASLGGQNIDWSGGQPRVGPNGDTARGASQPDIPLTETIRSPRSKSVPPTAPPPIPASAQRGPTAATIPPPVGVNVTTPTPPPSKRVNSEPGLSQASGEITVRPRPTSKPPSNTEPMGLPRVPDPVPAGTPPPPPSSSKPTPRITPSATPPVSKRMSTPIEMPQSTDDITQPGVQVVRTPVPGSMRIGVTESSAETRGSIMGIGMAHIGSSQVASGEISKKVSPGARVLVPGPNGLMQSATVRQLLQGYYELEVGGSGETIWVPVTGVVPE